MLFEPRVEFSLELMIAVVKTASALLQSEWQALLHADALSVKAAWARMDCTSYAGQTIAAPTLALVKALRIAHDEADKPSLWPTPEEELEERRRDKKQHRNSRDRGDRHCGGGGSGGGSKNRGGGDHHHRRESGSGGGGERRTSGAGGGSGRRLGSQKPGRGPRLWGRHRRAAEQRQRPFSVGRLVHLLPIVFDLEHGPRWGGRDGRQEVSRAMAGGASAPEAFTLLLRLLVTRFDRVHRPFRGVGVGFEEPHLRLMI